MLPISDATLAFSPSVSLVARNALADADILFSRALPNAPDGYTPKAEACPSTRPSVRSALTLSKNETDWLDARREKTVPAMRTFLSALDITDFDVDSYFSLHESNTSALPNVGLAFSGGGYRACLNGAGALKAFDSREQNSSISNGALGGLLQSATYVAGLSGGGWLVSSVFVSVPVNREKVHILTRGADQQFHNHFQSPGQRRCLGI